tara:strand:- start:1660 stop:1848 length:189 start_codon:yes stop_codon:yes gene_type:complete
MRGRKRLKEPNNRDKHVLEALREGHRPTIVARTYSISRQYVHEIMERWPELVPNRKKRKKTK